MRELTSHQTPGNPLNEQIRVRVMDNAGPGGMCHRYVIEAGNVETLLRFQRGPVLEAGVNGLSNEVLLAIVVDRLEGAQRGRFACKDNEDALGMIKGGLTCLHKRTATRLAQGVEGKSVPHAEVPASGRDEPRP
jgi:hypothetical protein